MTMKPFHLPRRLTRAPITVEEMSTPAIIGMVSRPDSVGVAPRASCMYWLRNTAVPNIATPTEIDAITESVKVRFLNRPSGMTGSFTRSSTITAIRSSRAAPPTMRRLGTEIHSKSLPAKVTQSSSSETPAEMSTMPR